MLRTALGPVFNPVTHLVFPQMTGAEMLGYLADEWSGGASPGAAPVHQSVQRIERFLAENAKRGQRAVVVVDEAHLLDEQSALETLRLLLNFRGGGEPGLALLLAGQPGILPILDRAPQLEERLAVKCLLRPLTERETAGYVKHRLKQAGAEQEIFEPPALEALFRLTHGIPRRINRLGDLALLIGYAEELHTVAADQVEAVHQELVTVAPD
jgi:general secretion pathway protein A